VWLTILPFCLSVRLYAVYFNNFLNKLNVYVINYRGNAIEDDFDAILSNPVPFQNGGRLNF
jgi:16S rRNA G1207 methylase RsmC